MAAPASIAVTVSDDEFSRFESGREIITCSVLVTGTSMLNEEVTVDLMKARRNRDVSVAYKTITLDSATTATYTVEFDLRDVVDSEGVSRVRRGEYFVQATSVTDIGIFGQSEDFRIALISVDRLKADYLYGVDLKATEILGVLEQPVNITGVTITEVSKGHQQAWFPLTLTVISGGSTTLSWCGGPQVAVVAGTRSYILRRGSTADYIRVKVPSLSALPVVGTTDELFVTGQILNSDRIRALIDQAISWIEDVELFVFLEPTKIVTKTDITAVTIPSGTDIPVFVQVDWDEVVDAISYRSPAGGHWMNFKMPYKPLIRFNELYGEVSNTRVVDIALEWIEAHERGAFVELVPFNQRMAFNFQGLWLMQSVRMDIPIANFWNFDALVGFRDLPAILLEVVAKKAAIDILSIAGMARRPGISSQSISRDGVSESVSYTASSTSGIYSAFINEYKDFISDNLKHFRGAFKGAGMVVL